MGSRSITAAVPTPAVLPLSRPRSSCPSWASRSPMRDRLSTRVRPTPRAWTIAPSHARPPMRRLPAPARQQTTRARILRARASARTIPVAFRYWGAPSGRAQRSPPAARLQSQIPASAPRAVCLAGPFATTGPAAGGTPFSATAGPGARPTWPAPAEAKPSSDDGPRHVVVTLASPVAPLVPSQCARCKALLKA